MKQLTDTERLEIAVMVLEIHAHKGHYERLCSELEHDCERNGFHNVPVECEDRECSECTMTDRGRRAIDCPYVDEDKVR